MDLYSVLGYLSGLYLIRPDMEPSTFIRTALLIHLLDGLLCRVIAIHSGRNRSLWTLGGLLFGIWALAPLFLLSEIDATRAARPKE